MPRKSTASIRLSERMKAITRMVTPGMRVCDLGCDHGFVSIYLAKENIAPSVLAMDIGKGPLTQAQLHIEEAGLSDRITTRLSDGLKQYQEGEADCLIIAGMGGPLMQEILSDKKAESFEELVLSPQSEIAEFRKFLTDRGLQIIAEDMICEDEKYYQIMKARWSRKENEASGSITIPDTKQEEIECRFGPLLLAQRHPVLKQYLEKEEHKYIRLLTLLKGYEGAKIQARRNTLEKELFFVRIALQEMEGEGSYGEYYN